MRKLTSRWIALGTLAVMTIASFGSLATPVQAGSKSKRNLAIGLGAVTAYGLIKKKKTLAIAGGIGTALAYKSYRSAKKKEDQQRAARFNRSRRYGNYRVR